MCYITKKEYDISSFNRWIMSDTKVNRVSDIITRKEYHISTFTRRVLSKTAIS